MAVRTFYLTNATGLEGFRQLSEVAQVAASTSDGWTVSTGNTFSSELFVGVKRAATTFTANTVPDGTLDTTNKDAFRTDAPLSGNFAATNWTFTFVIRTPTSATGQQGAAVIRLFRGPTTDGSGVTEITSAQQTGTTTTAAASTTTDYPSTVTFNPGAFSLNNEYLFIQIAWKRITAASMTTADVVFRTGSSASVGTRIVTANFTVVHSVAAAEGTVGTAADAPSNIATLGSLTAEGTATASDVSDTPNIYNVAVAEGNLNLLPDPEAFNLWPSHLLTASLTNTGPAPDGSATVELMQEGVLVTDEFYVYQSVPTAPGGTYSLSVHSKKFSAGGYIILGLRGASGDEKFAGFNPNTGAIVSTDSGITSAASAAAGTGWWRFSITRTQGSDTSASRQAIYFSNDGVTRLYYGVGVSTFLWGAQLQVGALTAYPAGTVAVDYPIAGLAVSAVVAEGGNTSADTPAGVLAGVRVGQVAWVRFTTPKGAGGVQSASVVEGTATALDTPSTTAVTGASCAEGTATAVDSQNATGVWAANAAEGSVTALDTSSTTAVLRPAVAEGTATCTDVPSAKATFATTLAEGTPTAADTPSAKSTYAATVAESTATAADTPSAVTVAAAVVAEGSPTATDVPLADLNQSQSAALAEGGVTAVDTPSATYSLSAAVAEGTATALDTPSVGTGLGVGVAEGTASAADTPTVAWVTAALCSEGTATALDIPAAGKSTGASVAEGSATSFESLSANSVIPAGVSEFTVTAADTPSAVTTFAASVAEGASTATDVPIGTPVSPDLGVIAEGTATAVDTCTPKVSYVLTHAEGAATAQDAPSATASWKASVVEAGVGLDTSSAGKSTSAAVVEGTASATDNQNADRQANAGVAEGGDTALDTESVTAIYQEFVTEGSASVVDLIIAYGDNEAFVFEVATLTDTVRAEVPDRRAERTPYFQVVSLAYVFAELYRYSAVYTQIEEPQPEFSEEEIEFRFTKPPLPSTKYTPLEKRVAKF